MPNIIELNLLNNKSIVATMQGHPLANENSYKIIAGEENATKFIIKSIPNQYANARLTVEMVNSQGLGIAERELSEIEVDLVSYKGFILPVGMAVAGYGYVSIKAYLDNSTTTIENGTVSVDYTKLAPYTAYTFIYNGSAWELNKNVVNLSSYGITISGTPKENDVIQVREKVVFQPLKLKVWNTLPNWEDGISNESSLKIENGHLYSNVNGVWIDIGNVGGEVDKVLSLESENAIQNKAVTIALSEKVNAEDYNNDIDDIRNDVKNLYAITAQGGLYTMLEVEQAFSSRETADGENIVDGQYTAPTKIQGSTVAYENVLKNAYFKGIKSTGKNLIPYPYYSMLEENYGVTFSYFEDGKIQVNGSSTAPLYSGIVLLKNLKLPVGYYILSGCPSGGSETTYKLFLMIHRADGTNACPGDYGEGGVVFNINEGDIVNYVEFRIFTGTTASNLVVAPMINSRTTATEYEPYKEDIYELPEAVELGKWDYIDVENKKVVRKTYQLTVNGDGAGQYKAQIMMYQNPTTGERSILCPFHGNEGGRAMTAGRDGAVVSQNNICEYATITGGASDIGFTTLQLVGVQVTTVEEAKALLAANPITFVYESFANSKITDLEETPERYQAWKNGSETVVQGDTDNSEYGAIPTVTTEYFKLTEV